MRNGTASSCVHRLRGDRPRLALCLAVAALAGCQSKPQDESRTIVSGVVTYNGQPLPGGVINFSLPDNSAGSGVKIRSEGKYVTDRAPVGKALVTIETESLLNGNAAAYVKIPAKYNDPATSGLSAEIKPGENADVNFDLKD